MSDDITSYNIPNGFLGIGPELLLETLHGMTSLRDVQQFLGLNSVTYGLLQNKHFEWSVETASKDRTGTKALVLFRLPHVHYLTEYENVVADKESAEDVPYNILEDTELVNLDAKRIQCLTVQYKNLRIDSNNSFFAHCMIYIDGFGSLRKKLVNFSDLEEIAQKKPLAEDWVKKITLPPPEVKFVEVRSSGNFTMALSTKGELWTRGWTDDGLWTDSEEFSVLPRFKTDTGLYQTSLGPSKVKSFCFEAIHAIIIFENGAVWTFGSIMEFAGYARDVPSDGFWEITNKAQNPPRFYKELSGSVDDSEGDYGIFGKHKVVKYFKKVQAFLTDDGIPIIRYIREIEHKNTYWYTPLDPAKFFGGKKIVSMNHHIRDMFLTEDGQMYIFYPDRLSDEVVQALSNPLYTIPLPVPLNNFKIACLCRQDNIVVLTNDGKILNVSFTEKDEDGKPKFVDVTKYVTERTVDEKNPNGLIIKAYGQSNLSCYFLAE